MEAWQDEPRVRPISMSADDIAGGDVNSSPEPPDPGNRPWLPITIAIAGVVLAVGSVALFGSVQNDDPTPPVAESDENSDEEAAIPLPTTTTVYRSLEDTVPGLTSRLTLITESPDGPTALLWDPSFAQPKPIAINYNAEHTARTNLDGAEFDAGGDFVAIAGHDVFGDQPWLWVGTPTDVAATDIPAVVDAEWHASEIGQLAWLTPIDDSLTLSMARINPLSLELMEEQVVATVPADSQIVRWDRHGYLIAAGDGGTVALSPAGEQLWQADGTPLSASDDTVLIADAYGESVTQAGSTDMVYVMPTAVSVLGRDGAYQASLFDEPPLESSTHRSVWITPTTEFIGRVDVIGQSTRLSVTGGSLVAIRQVRIPDDVLPLGFTHNEAFFVFEADGSNNIIFVNWNNGSFHEVPVPDDYHVIGFSIP